MALTEQPEPSYEDIQAWLEMSGVVDTHHRGIDDSDPRNEVTEEEGE